MWAALRVLQPPPKFPLSLSVVGSRLVGVIFGDVGVISCVLGV